MGLIDRVEPWKTKLQIATFLLAVIAFAMAIGRVSSGPIQSRLDIWLVVVV